VFCRPRSTGICDAGLRAGRPFAVSAWHNEADRSFLVDGRRRAAKRRIDEVCDELVSSGVAEDPPVTTPVRVKSPQDLRGERRRKSHSCWDHLVAAPLWPMHGSNLGTLLRTCDAVGACLAVPRLPWVPEALERGNTLRRPACVHWTGDQLGWLRRQRERRDTTVVGAELADEAVRLADLPPARGRSVLVLGHERDGIPPEACELLDVAVEIPMVGHGASLNVAVAGSLVLYRLAGLV
jgi:tRNA (guanosine-2'-O-)-methyltransferase